MTRRVAITGIGLVSSLGEGPAAHVAALRAGAAPAVDADGFAPYPVHPLPEIDFSAQIPKRSDQRQMERWQRIGVYAAGLALESAGLKDDAEATHQLDLLVAAGGGERDHEVDSAIVTGLLKAEDRAAYLNEHLANDLRPTLFLTQLSNLLAGNIAIVHGVTGGSRTFMGEEQAGGDAIRDAWARVAAGQCEAMLVGGAYNAERKDMMLALEYGGALHKGGWAPVFDEARRGVVFGSVGAFLALEPAEAAAARGAHVFAEIAGAATGWAKREAGGVADGIAQLVAGLGTVDGGALAVSAACGVAPWTAEERAGLARALPGARIVAAGDLIGHGLEAAFPAALALAAAAIDAGEAREAVVTGAGQWRGEAAARLAAPGKGGEA